MSRRIPVSAVWRPFWISSDKGGLYHEGFTLKVIKFKLQGASLAQAPSRAVGWALNKYSLLYLTLYVLFYIIFHKEGPKNCMNFRPQKTWVRPCCWSYAKNKLLHLSWISSSWVSQHNLVNSKHVTFLDSKQDFVYSYVGESFWYICLLGLLTSVTGS
jgi:hypothetical protein